MTALAFFAETPFVHVVVRMAFDAGDRCAVECQRRVALSATDDPMQAQQRVFRQVVIEHDVRAPCLLTMACVASVLELAAVRVFAAVAARAVLG